MNTNVTSGTGLKAQMHALLYSVLFYPLRSRFWGKLEMPLKETNILQELY